MSLERLAQGRHRFGWGEDGVRETLLILDRKPDDLVCLYGLPGGL